MRAPDSKPIELKGCARGFVFLVCLKLLGIIFMFLSLFMAALIVIGIDVATGHRVGDMGAFLLIPLAVFFFFVLVYLAVVMKKRIQAKRERERGPMVNSDISLPR